MTRNLSRRLQRLETSLKPDNRPELRLRIIASATGEVIYDSATSSEFVFTDEAKRVEGRSTNSGPACNGAN
jgi:hypothetical protein